MRQQRMIARGWIGMIALLVALMSSTGASALTPTPTPGQIQVGVVISVRGAVSSYCVTLDANRNTGLDALQATEVDLNFQAGPLGAAICRIQGVGCTAPSENCFCQCQGVQCSYWAYFFMNDAGDWQYSQLGAKSRTLSSGSVEGWAWSEGSSQTPTNTLPNTTFGEICRGGQPADMRGSADRAVQNAGDNTRLGWIALIVIAGGFWTLIWLRRRKQT